MENPDAITAIKHALQDCRREALTKFMDDFIAILKQEGFSYKDLLNALADWTNEQPGLTEAVKHLEEAASVVYDVYKHSK